MRRRAAALGLGLGVALIVGGCSDDDGDRADATTTTTEATTTASTEATTAPESEPPTSAPAPTGQPLPAQGVDWASELVRAWGAGDRARAGELATPEVVDQLFGHADPGGGDWSLLSCDSTAVELFCTFTDVARGESVVTEQGGPDPLIGTVRFNTASPEVPEALPTEADALVRAWGEGDRAGATAHAPESVVDQLFGFADPGGPGWARTACLTYHDDDPQCVYAAPDRSETVIVHGGGADDATIGFVYVFHRD